MSPRKPTIDGLDDVDDEDGALEEESAAPSDLSLDVRHAEDAGMGGLPPGEQADDTAGGALADDREDEE
jgi:hypothetical protein